MVPPDSVGNQVRWVQVAIKFLRPELARQPQLVERFRAEAVTLALIGHLDSADAYYDVLSAVRGHDLPPADRARPALENAAEVLVTASRHEVAAFGLPWSASRVGSGEIVNQRLRGVLQRVVLPQHGGDLPTRCMGNIV